MAIKLAISFGLVYIPVSLSAAVKNNDIGFNMIDKNTMSRIKYKKTCVDCNEKEVKNEDIVRGYQYEKDKYVIFTDKDFEKLKTEKDKTISIEQFVDLGEVDPIYFDKSYYVSPNGADKAFNLLMEAMKKQNKAGIAKTVLGSKDTLILLRVSENKMLLNTMFFAEEIVSTPEIKPAKLDKKEVELAETLINQLTSEFNISAFKDDYTERVKAAIKKKISGGQIVAPKEKKSSARVINIMDALKKSLTATKKQKPKAKKAEKQAPKNVEKRASKKLKLAK